MLRVSMRGGYRLQLFELLCLRIRSRGVKALYLDPGFKASNTLTNQIKLSALSMAAANRTVHDL